MSGPKCSSYQLSIQRRQEELRKIEERLHREAEERRREEMRRREEERRKAEEARRKAQEEEKKCQEELRIKNEEMTIEAAAIAEKIARKRRERKQKEAEENEKKRQEEWEVYNERILAEEAARKEELLKKREQEIIAEAIDEAMEELGYDLIASKATEKDEAVYVQAQVFSFTDGVGVQVVETEDRISMEIVGIGTNNRRPTEHECAYLESKMGDFCDTYEKLEEKLKEKGIVKANTIHRLPPDKKYARILNVENFENKKETTTLQTVIKKKTQQTQNVQMVAKKAQMRRME